VSVGDGLWVRRIRVWLPALAFLAVNLGVLAWDRVVLAGRIGAVERRLERTTTEREEVARRARELAERRQAIEANRERRERLHREWFGTPEQRLTAAIAEVKDLAARSGLEIRAISYPQESLEEQGLVRRSFVFSVQGSYGALRQLVYLLELTPSFLTLESIKVAEAGTGGGLRADLDISTLFVTEERATASPEGRS
jgi:Tfp pilus assembly protein PilO